jgi:hypothetical protein
MRGVWAKYLPVMGFVLAGHLAWADEFHGRAMAGIAAAENAVGGKYDLTIWPILRAAGNVCDPPGTVVPASELGHFALVGNITAEGQMVMIEVQPVNKISACFAAQMARSKFVPPPILYNNTYPITADLNITP